LPEPAWPQMRATSDYLPHVLSTGEVRRLLGSARQLGGHPFRRITYRMLILLLYCTGLRLGEAVRLRLCNVDLATGTLFVVASKGRSRWVPCHRTLCRELGGYLTTRRAFSQAGPAAFLFVGLDRTSRPTDRLATKVASDGLRALLRTAGLKPAAGRVGPRPYDFRHAFAVHRLTRWYRAGVDLQARLPWLSAYMGHDDLLGTETYLTATPELLALAAGRFRRRYGSPLAVR